MSATWTNAPASPQNNNVEAPINIGADDQEKAGGLTADSFSTKSATPVPKLLDETAGQRDWWLRGEANTFMVAADRNDDGSISGESPWPMLISAGAISTDDYVKFSDQVRAAQYF